MVEELDDDGTEEVEYAEFERVFAGGSGESSSRREEVKEGEDDAALSAAEIAQRPLLPALHGATPRLIEAERKWPVAMDDPRTLEAVREDFLQIRFQGAEEGSPRYERIGGRLALHVEMGPPCPPHSSDDAAYRPFRRALRQQLCPLRQDAPRRRGAHR